MRRGLGHEEEELSPSESRESGTQVKTGFEAVRRSWSECGSSVPDPAVEGSQDVSADPLTTLGEKGTMRIRRRTMALLASMWGQQKCQ